MTDARLSAGSRVDDVVDELVCAVGELDDDAAAGMLVEASGVSALLALVALLSPLVSVCSGFTAGA